MIEICEYRLEWPTEFARFAGMLQSALGPLALYVDHIGSTAVPGLAAKDVIDLQVTVRELAPDVAAAMTGAGFVRYALVTYDHYPPGVAERPEDWRKFLFLQPAGDRRAHIHVRELGRPNQRYPLLFRDYLIAHPRTAAAYATLKRQLAVSLVDPRTYPEVKDPAVDLIYLAAEAWADAVGWAPAPAPVPVPASASASAPGSP